MEKTNPCLETISYPCWFLENHCCVVCWFHSQSHCPAKDGRHLFSGRQKIIYYIIDCYYYDYYWLPDQLLNRWDRHMYDMYDYGICQTSVSVHQYLRTLITEIDWHWFLVLNWPTETFPWLERANVVVFCIVCRGPTSLGGASRPGPGGPMKRTRGRSENMILKLHG